MADTDELRVPKAITLDFLRYLQCCDSASLSPTARIHNVSKVGGKSAGSPVSTDWITCNTLLFQSVCSCWERVSFVRIARDQGSSILTTFTGPKVPLFWTAFSQLSLGGHPRDQSYCCPLSLAVGPEIQKLKPGQFSQCTMITWRNGCASFSRLHGTQHSSYEPRTLANYSLKTKQVFVVYPFQSQAQKVRSPNLFKRNE